MKKNIAVPLLAALMSTAALAQLYGTDNNGRRAPLAPSAATDTTNAANISSGTLPAARLPIGTNAGTVAAGNDARITGAAQKSANLSDLASVSSARGNLGLGTAATQDVGTAAGNVVQLDGSAAMPAVDTSPAMVKPSWVSAFFSKWSDVLSDNLNLRRAGAAMDAESWRSGVTTCDPASNNVAVPAPSTTAPIVPAFDNSYVGKIIAIAKCGATESYGYVTSVPVSSPGSGFTSTPTINISGATTEQQYGLALYPLLKIVSATSPAGTCTKAGLYYANIANKSTTAGDIFNSPNISPAGLPGYNLYAAIKLTLTVSVDGGPVTAVGFQTDTNGVPYAGAFSVPPPNLTRTAQAVTWQSGTTAGTCSGVTVTLNLGVGGVLISGNGGLLPVSGVTASISGGGGSGAVLGTPSIAPIVRPLQTTITAVSGGGRTLTLADKPLTSFSGATSGVVCTDDTQAWIDTFNAHALYAQKGQYRTIRPPAGNSCITRELPVISKISARIAGDAQLKSQIVLMPSVVQKDNSGTAIGPGRAFAFSENWHSAEINNTISILPTTHQNGVEISDLSVFMFRDANAFGQIAFDLLDRTDEVRIFRTYVFGALAHVRTGEAYQLVGTAARGFTREMVMVDNTCVQCGSYNYGSLHFYARSGGAAAGVSDNNILIYGYNSWGLKGIGLYMGGDVAAGPTKRIRCIGCRWEADDNGADGSPLVSIGCALPQTSVSGSGSIEDIQLIGNIFNSPPINTAAVKVCQPTGAEATLTSVRVDGSANVGPVTGGGAALDLGGGTNGEYTFANCDTYRYAFILSSAANVGTGNRVDFQCNLPGTLLDPGYVTNAALQPAMIPFSQSYVAGQIPTSSLVGTIPTSMLTGTFPASSLSGNIAVANGGTGATTAAGAALNLGYGYRICGNSPNQTFTGTLAETLAWNCTIPAGQLGATGRLLIREYWTFTGSAGAKTVQSRYSQNTAGVAGTIFGVLTARNSPITTDITVLKYVTNLSATSQVGGIFNTANKYSTTPTLAQLAADLYPNSTAIPVNTANSSQLNETITIPGAGDTATLVWWEVNVVYGP